MKYPFSEQRAKHGGAIVLKDLSPELHAYSVAAAATSHSGSSRSGNSSGRSSRTTAATQTKIGESYSYFTVDSGS